MNKQLCSNCRTELPRGPLTHEEFLKLHPAEQTEAKPPAWETPELLELQANVEAAERDYEECLAAFAVLDRKVSLAGGYDEKFKPGMSTHKQAANEAAAAWALVEVAGEKLQRARAVYYRLAKRLETEHVAREYQQSQEEQERARKAKEAAKRQGLLDRARGNPLLGGLAKKLVGA
jgi:hypothetical protein